MSSAWTLLLLGTLISCAVYTHGSGNPVADCCLQTSNKPIHHNVVTGYEMQTTDKGCMKTAVLFLTNTRPSRKLCAPVGSPWVIKLMKRLDRLKKETKKREKAERKSKKPPQTKLE
ncbi:C-C motif chemokine 19-like [Hyperolius riggenbachi]|uniref:C-C motif chemokine 19-like n=1 Tax=Hyperolius riggenbachi TaxID=752182 RepID=UPI0035A2FF80